MTEEQSPKAASGEPKSEGAVPQETSTIDLGTKKIEECLAVGLVAISDMQPGEADSPRFEGIIVGWRPKSYIIWQMRVDPAVPWRIVHDEPTVVRFFSEGRACAMRVYLSDWHIRGRYRVVYLSWPDEVRYRIIRKKQRIDLELLCEATLESKETLWGTVLQLSENGCRLYLPMKNVKDRPVSMTFTLPNEYEIVDLPLVVRHASRSGDGVVFGCEVDASKLNQEDNRALCFLVESMLGLNSPTAETSKIGLVLANNSDDHTALVSALRERNASLIATHRVTECFAWLQIRGARVVFIDADLKDMSVLDVVRTIKQTPISKGALVYVFGGNESELKPKAEALGAKYVTSLASSPEMIENAANLINRSVRV